MIFKRLNRTSPEQVFVVMQANESGIAADDVVALEDSSPDGVKIQQPTTATLSAIVGVADAAIANGAYGLVQVYGYRSTSRIQVTSSQSAFMNLKPVTAADFFISEPPLAGSGIIQPSFICLESIADQSGSTVSRKIFIRCM